MSICDHRRECDRHASDWSKHRQTWSLDPRGTEVSSETFLREDNLSNQWEEQSIVCFLLWSEINDEASCFDLAGHTYYAWDRGQPLRTTKSELTSRRQESKWIRSVDEQGMFTIVTDVFQGERVAGAPAPTEQEYVIIIEVSFLTIPWSAKKCINA